MRMFALAGVALVLMVGCGMTRPNEIAFIEKETKAHSPTPDSVKIVHWELLASGKRVKAFYVEMQEQNTFGTNITSRFVFYTYTRDGSPIVLMSNEAPPNFSFKEKIWTDWVWMGIQMNEKAT